MASPGCCLANRHFHRAPLNTTDTSQFKIHKRGNHHFQKTAQKTPVEAVQQHHSAIFLTFIRPTTAGQSIASNWSISSPDTNQIKTLRIRPPPLPKNNDRARPKTSSAKTFRCHLCGSEVPLPLDHHHKLHRSWIHRFR